jgi:hypothetical protein
MRPLGMKGLVVVLAVVAAIYGGIYAIQARLGPLNAVSRGLTIRYIPDRDVLALTSFGYRTVYADILWVKVIQDLAKPFDDPNAKYEWADSVFQGITDLDPRFVSAYRLGACWLSLIRRNGDAAVRLLEKGVEENPGVWQLPYDLAMIHFVDRKDRHATFAALKIAIETPSCPIHVRSFASQLMLERDEGWIAIAMWLDYLQQHDSEIFRNVVRESICKTQMKMLRTGVDRFREAHGRNPAKLTDLFAARIIEPKPGFFDLLDGIAYEPVTGEIDSPKLDGIQIAKHLYLYREAVRRYMADPATHGRKPRSIRDLNKVLHRPPRHPRHREGYDYRLDPETLEIEVREPDGVQQK